MPTPSRRSSALLVVAAAALLVRPIGADDKAPPKVVGIAEKAGIADRLARTATIDKFEGKFEEAVQLFREKYDLPLVIDPSFKLDDGGGANEAVKLPKLTGVRLDSALRLLCDQANTMFLTEPDHIRIVAAAAGVVETGIWKPADPADPDSGEEATLSVLDRLKYQPPIRRALVNASFRAKPLSGILDTIAETTGANVILAPQAAEQAKQEISVRFANTPVEAAVRTLCEMTDLGVIEDTNVLIVTTSERAAIRNKVIEDKRKARRAEAATTRMIPVWGPGGGIGPIGTGVGAVAPAADVAGDLARLKEQNEQLKKQLDEIQRQLKK